RGKFDEWNKGTKGQSGAEAFRKDKDEALWPLAKLEIDKALKLATAPTPEEQSLEKIDRWSRRGKVLGWLRFKFGWVLQKIEKLVIGLKVNLMAPSPASSIISAVRRCSSSRPRETLRCVERCCPSAAQARRSETCSCARTCLMQARRRAGLR